MITFILIKTKAFKDYEPLLVYTMALDMALIGFLICYIFDIN